MLTLKALRKFAADNILNFCFFGFQKENKTWHFMWTSYEMSSYLS